jgi:hypothetical protein
MLNEEASRCISLLRSSRCFTSFNMTRSFIANRGVHHAGTIVAAPLCGAPTAVRRGAARATRKARASRSTLINVRTILFVKVHQPAFRLPGCSDRE